MQTSNNRFWASCSRSFIQLQRFFLAFLFLTATLQLSAQLATWDFDGETVAGSSTFMEITADDAAFGPGVGGVSFPSGNGSADSYSGNSWTTAAAFDADDYLEVSLSSEDCSLMEIRGFDFEERRSSTGPTQFYIEVNFTLADGTTGSSGVATGSMPDNTSWRSQEFDFTLDCIAATFRIYGFDAEGSTGTWRFDNIAIQSTADGVVSSDNMPPTVTCAEFTETYPYCADFLGPNSPSGTWISLPPNGMITSSAGGIFSQTVDVSTCVSDDISELDDIEFSTIASYEENRTDCMITIVNEYAFRDECENVADETVLVKFVFEDPGVDPTITCPGDVTVECGASTDPSATGMATADDDCPAPPAVTFSDSFAPGCSSGTGMITRTWTATDECGGSSDCVQTITIADTQAPIVSCATFTTTFDGGCSSNLGPNTPSGGFGPIPENGIIGVLIGFPGGEFYDLDLNGCVSDDCSDGFSGMGIRLVSSELGADDDCGQTLTNTYDIQDACGNISTDLVTIVATFGDTEAPTVTCDDFTATYNDCPIGLGPNTPNGEWQDVPASGTFLAASGGSYTVEVDLNGCVSDNCGDLEDLQYTLVDSYSEDFVAGCSITLVNELAIRDACGNVSDDIIITRITIEDQSTTPPAITCPANTTVECGSSTDPSITGQATANTDCGVAAITFNDNFDPGGCGSGTGVIARTWTATSPCGITSTCVQSITIIDTSPPTITCPADVTVECGDPTDPMSTGEATATDDCSGVNFDFSDMMTTDGCNASSGVITRTFLAIDDCGNQATCTQNITIVDSTPPVLAMNCTTFAETFEGCPQPLGPNVSGASFTLGSDGTFLSAAGGSFITEVDLNGCVTEACGDFANLQLTVVASYEENTSDCSTTIVNEYSIQDECGNVSESNLFVRITIENTSDAVIVCPANADLTCGDSTDPADTGMATASDACGSVPVTFSDEITMRCNAGAYVIIRTWTAEGCGEPASCEQLIILRDEEAPVFNDACETEFTFTTEEGSACPADAMISLEEGDEIGLDDTFMVGGLTAASLAGCVSDNCALDEEINITVDDITISHASACSRIFNVTFIADDGCNNNSEPFTLTYIVEDDTAPVFDLDCQIDAVFTTENGNVCPADATFSLSEGDEIDVFTGYTVGGVAIPSLQGCVGDNCADEAALVITVDDITIVDDGTCSRTITVTFIADDGCGNDSEPFVCNYIFIDDTAPVFDVVCQVDAIFTTEDGNVCPADATISLNEGDELTVNDGWTVGGIDIPPLAGCVSDNCNDDDDLTITVDDITIVDDGTCSRTITVTFIADDGCGNDSEPFVCNYTFVDNTGPEMTFNGIPDGGTYTVECDLPSETWDPLIDFDELDISDVCSDVDFSTLTEVLTQLYDGPCAGGLLTRWQQVFTVEDVCGNETVYTLFTEIIDTTPPVFESSPEDVTIECDEIAEMPELEAFDSCSDVTYNFTEVRTDGDCPNNYTLTRTWTATDGCGNASDEVQIITVEDTTPPVIEFIDGYINQYEPGDDVFVECSEYGNISQLIANNAVATDNCSGNTPVEYTFQDLGSFNCLEVGYSGRLVSTWTSKDECGNTSTATINWYLVDETAPIFQNLPSDVCADADDLPPVADVQAVDNCEFASLTFSQSDPIDCDGGGQYIERTWTAEDACGNSDSYTQRITLGGANGLDIVIDYPEIGDVMNGDLIQLPIDCDQEIGFSLEDLEAAISVSDGCGAGSGQATIEISLMDEGDCQENGYLARYRVNVSAMDACGNNAELNIMIDFVDQTPPVVSGDASITLGCGDEIPMPIAEDACGEIASMTFVDSAPIEASCPDNPVAYDRTWTVTDACGNAATFTQSIIILDNEGPVFSGIPADACNNTALDVVVTAIDGCTGNQAQVSFDEVMSSETGCGEVLTRTWTATDACGNTSTATQQVFFDDNIAPTIAFTSDLLFGLENGDELFLNVGDGLGDPNNPLLLTADDVTVTDNCATITAEVIVETTLSEDCASDGFLAQYDYKFVATDPCGNSAAIKLTVFYVDANGPDFFNVPEDVEVFCATIPEVAGVTASDDFDEDIEVIFSETQVATPEGVLITRTWTATDDCGNTNSVSQEILVVNNDLDATFSLGSDVIECNSDDNRLGVTASGGTPPYSYEWQLTFPLEDGYITTDPTQRAILFTMGYITQTFTVIITDANGCEYAASVTVVCDFSGDEGDFTGNGNGNSLSLNVYPNPASEQMVVKANGLEDTPVTVALYNLFGQEMTRTDVNNWPQEGLTIDTRRFPNGTYVLRLTADGKEVQTREVVILH